jgi:hypothetical protein
MKKNLIIVAFAFMCLTAVYAAQANIITQWNFNSNPSDANTATGTTATSIGSGSIKLVGGVTVDSAGAFNDGSSNDTNTSDNSGYVTTNYPAQSTGNKTGGIEFDLSTAGYQSISISFDLRTSNTSSKCYRVQYSIDGTNFTDYGTAPFTGKGDNWNLNKLADLSAITGVNDNPNFKLRVVTEFDPDNPNQYTSANKNSGYATTGKYRWDMVTVSGVPVPEPSSVILLVAGLASGLGYLRLRRKHNA